jgi:hypothetical protein
MEKDPGDRSGGPTETRRGAFLKRLSGVASADCERV